MYFNANQVGRLMVCDLAADRNRLKPKGTYCHINSCTPSLYVTPVDVDKRPDSFEFAPGICNLLFRQYLPLIAGCVGGTSKEMKFTKYTDDCLWSVEPVAKGPFVFTFVSTTTQTQFIAQVLVP